MADSIRIRDPPHSEDKIGRFNEEGNEATFGFVPQMVTPKQVEALLVSDRRRTAFLSLNTKIALLMLVWGHKPFEQTTILRPAQSNAGEPQETPHVHPNHGVLRHGE